MKLGFKAVCFLLFLFLASQAPLCFAQTIDVTGVSLSAEGVHSMDYFQGDEGSIEVWVKNNGSVQVGITLARAYFDWAEPNVFNLSLSSVVYIDVGDELCIGEINFSVPMDASVGFHSYHLYIEFESQGETHTWQNSEKLIWVEDYYKGLCDEFFSTAYSKLTTARNAVAQAQSAIQSLGDPQDQEIASLLSQAQDKLEEAQTHLNQAENAYNNAVASYNSGAFQTAYTSFQECANVADNASVSAAEASSLTAQAQHKEIEQQQQQQQQRHVQQAMLFGIPIAIVVAALIVIVLIIKRR